MNRTREVISRRWLAAMAGCAMLAAGGSIAVSQDQSIATPKDTIFARKILMDTLNQNMDDLEAMIEQGKIELNEGKDHSNIVSVMLLAFPHLFPPATNEWKPNVERDAGRDTFAAPEVWTNFADFYKRAQNASQLAYKASRAEDEAQFKDFIGQLRVACNSCHAVYLKTQ
jgi:cytochrome c556